YGIVDGKGDSNGIVSIDGVPSGVPYILRITPPKSADSPDPVPTLYYTDKHDLDLGYVIPGRSNATAAHKATPVSVSLTNMTPWSKYGGELWAASMSADTAHLFD